jgi:Ca2+-binding RTX toxin-like protein
VLGNSSGSIGNNEIYSSNVNGIGQNIVGMVPYAFDATTHSNIENANPILVFETPVANGFWIAGGLADNGGLVQTVALRKDLSNPAIDRASASYLPGDIHDLDGNGNYAENLPVDGRGVGYGRTEYTGSKFYGVDLGAYEAQVPVSLIVDTAADIVDAFDGVTSLREAVSFVNNGQAAGPITFDASVFNGEAADVIRLSSGRIDIFGTVTIDGDLDDDGTPDVVISGDTSGNDLLDGNGLTAINASKLAGVLSDNTRLFLAHPNADATLDGLTLTGGYTSLSYEHGGAIQSYGGVTLSNSAVVGNGTGGSGAKGGGIYLAFGSSGGLTITNSTISHNSVFGINATGGGIHSAYDASITDSSITENSSMNYGASGGGIFTSGDLILTRSDVSFNSTYSGGGGVFANGNAYVTDSTFSGNMSVGVGGYGGGIATYGNLYIEGSRLIDNTSASGGGGAWSNGGVYLTNSTVSNNSTTYVGGAGGGIAAEGQIIAVNSTIDNNWTEGDASYGGGVAAHLGVTLINSTVAENHTQGSGSAGGGIASDHSVYLHNATVTGNYTLAYGAAGGGIITGIYSPSTLYSSNSIVLGNTTVGGTAPGPEVYSGSFDFTGNNRVGANAAAYGNVNNGNPAQIFAGVVNNNGVGAGLLADNGGQAPTVALKDDPTNPALNVGLITAALGSGLDEAAFGVDLNGNGTATDVLTTIADLPFDNRGDGFARIIGTGLDIGAFELTVAGPFQGTAAADTLFGTDGDDILNGQGGNDIINGAGGDDELNGGDDDDVLNGGPGADTINGNGGTDTASFAAASAGVTVYLENSGPNTGDAAGDTFSSIENIIGTDFGDDLRGTAGVNTIFGRDGVDFLYGLAGADQLFGEDGNDFLVGGADGDLLNGGTGTDRAGYWTATAGVTADLMTPANNTGDAAGDTYVSIENLQGSAHADDLRGDNAVNLLVGNNGDDILRGRGGNDVLQGQNDNDILIGDAGADQLDGGGGTDRASYIFSGIGLVVDLSFTNANTGEAVGDTFIGIEGLDGSNHNDDLRGDNNANTILGNAGNDMLYGRGGNDSLFGGADNDILIGGAGGDALDGGNGQDEARYHQAGVGIKADLANSGVNTGEAAGDTYTSIENLFGSTFGDTLSGDDFANVLSGHGGNDTINGRGGADLLLGGDGDDNLIGGAGVDHYNGGNGVDRVQYQDSTAGLRVDLQVSSTNTGDAAGETYVLIEDIVSSSGNDSLFGNASANKLFGFDGVDRVFGRAGNDTLFGGDGNDIVNGGADDDILVGGQGVDTFRFDGADFGTDRITDFTPGETIDLQFYAGLAFTDLNIVDVAGRAEVSFTNGDIILTGIQAVDVMESWFSFAP